MKFTTFHPLKTSKIEKIGFSLVGKGVMWDTAFGSENRYNTSFAAPWLTHNR